jgi:tetratricopeptide (TPR) repeat protein
MPRLSPVQWAVFLFFLLFYGFAVFALTRDYYLRHPPQAVAGPAAERAVSGAEAQGQPRTFAQQAMQGGGTAAIPEAITESNPELLMKKATALFEQERYGQAIPVYRRVLELEPVSPEAHNDLGLALFYSGQQQTALDVLREGTKKTPGFQRLWLTLGFVSAQSGDEAVAQQALEKARSLGPDTAIGQEAARILGLLAKK